jgi:hypothetical protein
MNMLKQVLKSYCDRHGLTIAKRGALPQNATAQLLKRQGNYILEVCHKQFVSVHSMEYGYSYPAGVRPLSEFEMLVWLSEK